MTANWPAMDKNAASRNALLEFQEISAMGRLLCLQASALNMSNMTNVVKVMVRSRLDTVWSSSISCRKTYIVPASISSPDVSTRYIRGVVMISSPRRRGGRCITAGSTFSTPRLCASGPSMMMLIHRICMGFRGWADPSGYSKPQGLVPQQMC